MDKIPVFIGKGLPSMPNDNAIVGMSVYKDTLVLWDEDVDSRVIGLLDSMLGYHLEKLAAVYEHEGGVLMYWKGAIPDKYADGSQIGISDGDSWSITSHVVPAHKA